MMEGKEKEEEGEGGGGQVRDLLLPVIESTLACWNCQQFSSART